MSYTSQEREVTEKLGDDEYTPGPKIFSPPGGNDTPDVQVEAKEDQIVRGNQGLPLSESRGHRDLSTDQLLQDDG